MFDKLKQLVRRTEKPAKDKEEIPWRVQPPKIAAEFKGKERNPGFILDALKDAGLTEQDFKNVKFRSRRYYGRDYSGSDESNDGLMISVTINPSEISDRFFDKKVFSLDFSFITRSQTAEQGQGVDELLKNLNGRRVISLLITKGTGFIPTPTWVLQSPD